MKVYVRLYMWLVAISPISERLTQILPRWVDLAGMKHQIISFCAAAFYTSTYYLTLGIKIANGASKISDIWFTTFGDESRQC